MFIVASMLIGKKKVRFAEAEGRRGCKNSSRLEAALFSMNEPATSHRLTAVDGEARNHDVVGNTTSIGSKTFIYNDANRMNAVKQGDAVLESYGYNHRGERVLRTRPVARLRSPCMTKQRSGWAITRPRARRNSRPSGWTTTRWR